MKPRTRRYILVLFLVVVLLAATYLMYRASGRFALGGPGESVIVVQLPEQARVQHSLLAGYTEQWSWTDVVEPLRWPGLMKPAEDWSLEPGVALGYELSTDGKSVRFTLSPDATWYMGEDVEPAPVTATDVVETWKLMLRLNPDLRDSIRGVSVSAQDEAVLQFSTVDPTVFWRFATVGILPGSAVEKVSTRAQLASLDLWTTPVTAGPCVPAWSDPDNPSFEDSEWMYTRRPAAGEDEEATQGPQRLVLRFVKSPADDTGDAALVDLGPVPAGDNESWFAAAQNLADRGYQVLMTAAPQYVSLGLNTQRGPLQNAELRKALDAATDRQAIIDSILQGYGLAGSGPFPPGSWPVADLEAGENTGADVEAAKKTLAAAGYVDRNADGYVEEPDGGMPELTILVPDGTPEFVKTAELLIGMWQKVGIRARTEKVEPDVYVKRVFLDRNFDGFLYTWPVSMDLDPAPIWKTEQTRRGGINPVGLTSPDVDRLLGTAASTINHESRQEAYMEFANLMRKKTPHLFLFWPGNVVMVHPDLEGVKPATQGFAWNIDEWSWQHEPSR